MEYKLLAKLFNSSELKRIAAGDLSTIDSIRKVFSEFHSHVTVSEFYDEAYKLLLKNYRNEYVVKNEIANKILLGTLYEYHRNDERGENWEEHRWLRCVERSLNMLWNQDGDGFINSLK